MTEWFTSDHHFGHWTNDERNIIKFCDRPFSSIGEMDVALIETWNRYVKPGDVVYHLGDFTLRGESAAAMYFSQLHGIIRVLPGSHDQRWFYSEDAYFSLDHEEVIREPALLTLEGKIQITLCHYSMRTWPGSFYGSFSLFGHSHNRLPGWGRSMDVGVDAIYDRVGQYRPISFEEVVVELSSQEPFLDGKRGS